MYLRMNSIFYLWFGVDEQILPVMQTVKLLQGPLKKKYGPSTTPTQTLFKHKTINFNCQFNKFFH